MTDTIDDVAAEAVEQGPAGPGIDEQGVAEQLVTQAREKGIELVGPNGLLTSLTKRVLEAAPPRAASRNSARPTGSGIRHIGHLDVLHGLAGPRCVYDLPVAGVEPHMVDVAVEEHKVTQLQIRLCHGPAAAELLSRRMRKTNANRSPGPHRQSRAVPGAWPRATAAIGLTELGLCVSKSLGSLTASGA